MSKKIFIIISVVLGIFLIALVAYYFLIQTNTPGADGKPSGFKSFFPFGNSSDVTPNTNTDNTQTVATPTTPATPEINYTKKLRELSVEPVSGAGIVDVKIATSSAGSVVRYMEKATGHIYDVELFSPKITRVSNTTIPLAYTAQFSTGNQNVVTQFINDDNRTVRTYVFTVNTQATSTQEGTTGFVLGNRVTNPRVLGTTLFYLEQYPSYSLGFTGTLDGKQRKQVWNSPLKEVNVQLVNPTTVALTTKPYQNINGYLYTVNTATGKSTKILGTIAGLSTLVDPTNTKILFISQTGSLNFWVFDIKTQNSLSITPKTFPEKCVWSKKDVNTVYCAVPDGYLDSTSLTQWYEGTASFTDSIWKYDLKNNTSTMIESLSSESGEAIDVETPILSDSEQYLIFTNKRNGSLWSLDLSK